MFIGRDKSREPSSHIARQELGDIEVRLAKVKLKLIDGDEKFEELDLHLDELSAGMEVQGALNAAIDKFSSGKETTRHSLEEELTTVKRSLTECLQERGRPWTR